MKFRYGQKVRIKEGFYAGLIGVIVATTKDFSTLWKRWYEVKLPKGDMEDFSEKDLEPYKKSAEGGNKK